MTCKLLNSSQHILTGVKYPRSRYSRCIGLAAKAAAGVGATDIAYTPALGNWFWILNMHVWWGGSDLNNVCGGNIWIAYGTGVPTAGIMLAQWTPLVPFYAGTTKPAIQVFGLHDYFWFEMKRRFETESMRLGLHISNGYAARPFWVNVWFEISEG